MGSGQKSTHLAFLILVATLFLIAWPTAARADTITTFNLSGTFTNGGITGNFSGSITIDTTTGLLSSYSLNAGPILGTVGGACVSGCGLVTITGRSTSTGTNTANGISAQDSFGRQFQITFLQSSLIGVTTLTLDPSAFNLAGSGPFDVFACQGRACFFTSGSITPATVPEPSSFALLGSGLVAVISMARRKGCA